MSNKALLPLLLHLVVLQMEQYITVLGKASMVEYRAISKEKYFYLCFKLLYLAYLQTEFGLLFISLNKIWAVSLGISRCQKKYLNVCSRVKDRVTLRLLNILLYDDQMTSQKDTMIYYMHLQNLN